MPEGRRYLSAHVGAEVGYLRWGTGEDRARILVRELPDAPVAPTGR